MQMKGQGILLQAFPYLGKGRVLKVFLEEGGLITLMAKKASSAIFSPFCIAEWVYQKRHSDIFSLIDASLLDSLDHLRQSYTTITAAGSMAQDILRSQLSAKSAPGLYLLLTSYFKKIPTFSSPLVLAASFRLKLLLHEGLLTLQSECAECGREATFLRQGEGVCPAHASPLSIGFSQPEWQTLHCLAFARQFSLLQQIDCLPSLSEKIVLLFEERLKH